METFYLKIEKPKTEAEMMEGQPENLHMELGSQIEVESMARYMKEIFYPNEVITASCIINRHSAEGNEQCSEIKIEL